MVEFLHIIISKSAYNITGRVGDGDGRGRKDGHQENEQRPLHGGTGTDIGS